MFTETKNKNVLIWILIDTSPCEEEPDAWKMAAGRFNVSDQFYPVSKDNALFWVCSSSLSFHLDYIITANVTITDMSS